MEHQNEEPKDKQRLGHFGRAVQSYHRRQKEKIKDKDQRGTKRRKKQKQFTPSPGHITSQELSLV